ncbi:MAG TPA: hypothetical protein ENN88_02215, partial [Candidatus Coatesbacteria bacterium]|nr:hypothetical protein [Candidatus Coatesbacteria bacterium]
MRRAGFLIFLFALAVPLAGTEIRVAQVADEELISVEGPAVESESRRVARLNAKIHDLSSRLRHTYQQYLDAGGRAEG